ncbi:hypothetical protein B0H14DRAFT_2656637 [Mycena olivaceomarginata]|nr:hypothetical protein B0H14DRAFT_2656637 [Mycena olivaceomarginata]
MLILEFSHCRGNIPEIFFTNSGVPHRHTSIPGNSGITAAPHVRYPAPHSVPTGPPPLPLLSQLVEIASAASASASASLFEVHKFRAPVPPNLLSNDAAVGTLRHEHESRIERGEEEVCILAFLSPFTLSSFGSFPDLAFTHLHPLHRTHLKKSETRATRMRKAQPPDPPANTTQSRPTPQTGYSRAGAQGGEVRREQQAYWGVPVRISVPVPIGIRVLADEKQRAKEMEKKEKEKKQTTRQTTRTKPSASLSISKRIQRRQEVAEARAAIETKPPPENFKMLQNRLSPEEREGTTIKGRKERGGGGREIKREQREAAPVAYRRDESGA